MKLIRGRIKIWFNIYFHFIIINNFLYNIYDMARLRDKKWLRGHMIKCLVGT